MLSGMSTTTVQCCICMSRVYVWHDPAPGGAHPVPDRLLVRQEGTGESHHVLDTQQVLPLGRQPGEP